MKQNKKKGGKKKEDLKKQNTPKLDDLSGIEDPTKIDLSLVILKNTALLSPHVITGMGITAIVFLMIFGKVMVVTGILSGIGFTAGKIVKRIGRKKECSI